MSGREGWRRWESDRVGCFGLLCVKREVDGIEVVVVGIYEVEAYAGVENGAYDVLERGI